MFTEVQNILRYIFQIPSDFISLFIATDDYHILIYFIYPFIIGLACFVIYEILRIILKQVYR